MTIPSMLEWIESTELSVAIREGGLPYPIIGGVHLLAIALFGGALLAVDLRLLGWLMPGRAFSDVWYQFRPWKRLGFVIVVVTGLLLAWAEPVRLYGSPSFWVKMSLFALVGVHALAFRAKVYGHPEKLDAGISSQARLAAVLSLILWAGLIVSGRLIAFDASFEPVSPSENRATSHAVGTSTQGTSGPIGRIPTRLEMAPCRRDRVVHLTLPVPNRLDSGQDRLVVLRLFAAYQSRWSVL